MVTLPTYNMFLICTEIDSPHDKGGFSHQGADKAYVTLLLEATYVFQSRHFTFLIAMWLRLRSAQAANPVPAADDVALQGCANVATTGFCVLLASLAERCYSN